MCFRSCRAQFGERYAAGTCGGAARPRRARVRGARGRLRRARVEHAPGHGPAETPALTLPARSWPVCVCSAALGHAAAQVPVRNMQALNKVADPYREGDPIRDPSFRGEYMHDDGTINECVPPPRLPRAPHRRARPLRPARADPARLHRLA